MCNGSREGFNKEKGKKTISIYRISMKMKINLSLNKDQKEL